MKDGQFSPSMRAAMILAILGEHDDNSPNCIATRASGELVSKDITISGGAGTPAIIDLFTITGAVRIFGVSGIFTDVTNVTDIDAVYLDVDDGGVATVDLTLAAGVECDGVVAKAMLIKIADATAALTKMDADQVRIDETDPKRVLYPFVVNAKGTGTTKLRMRYDSGGSLDLAMTWVVEWRHLNRHDDGNIVAA